MHYKYVHTPLNRLQYIATNGVLPKRLTDFTLPISASCIYGNSTKRPCKTKTERLINESKPAASVGDCVSVDVLVYSTPGLILNMSVFLMRKRYQYSLMFVENYYDFTYIHQQSIKLDMKKKKNLFLINLILK